MEKNSVNKITELLQGISEAEILPEPNIMIVGNEMSITYPLFSVVSSMDKFLSICEAATRLKIEPVGEDQIKITLELK